jgi:hypothetical protein
MESDKKIKVHIVLKCIDNKRTNRGQIVNTTEDNVLQQLKDLFTSVSGGKDEVETKDILRLLSASKLANESMADAFANINCEDLFDHKMDDVSIIEDIIKQIKEII